MTSPHPEDLWHEYVGNIHLHTVLSDGSGTMQEVVQAAREAGLDFVIPTDHNVFAPEHEGWREGVLLLVGEEVHDEHRNPEASHYLALGIREDVAPLARDMQKVVRAVASQGGIGFLAHPYERPAPLVGIAAFPWLDWDVEGYTGISIWNYMSEYKSYLTSWPRALLSVFWPSRFIRGPFPETLALWDDLLRARRVPAIGASDAHAGWYRLGPLERVVFPYAYVFRCVNTHILLPSPFTGDLEADRRLVLDALAAGHAFVAYDLLGDARGFRFAARDESGQVGIMGDEVHLREGLLLEVQTPMPGRIRLLRDGEEAASVRGTRLAWPVPGPGVYRVEVHRRKWFRQRAWVLSNPVYIRG
ncbi:MAG: PHP domain-containing protein [Anaerolineae bacterium]|nr:PHP domain-containing protein [Anaerolineae bacterium]